MGYEIRMVPDPLKWSHPIADPPGRGGKFVPLLPGTFEAAFKKWEFDLAVWLCGNDEDQQRYHPGDASVRSYMDWAGRSPNPIYYGDYKGLPLDHYAVYENATEGTPLTPAFKTKQELFYFITEVGLYFFDKIDRDYARKFIFRFTPDSSYT